MKCANCGHDPRAGECFNCGRPIYYDLDSGYWLHSEHEKVDGRNGLYCEPGMWDGTVERVYARPKTTATP